MALEYHNFPRSSTMNSLRSRVHTPTFHFSLYTEFLETLEIKILPDASIDLMISIAASTISNALCLVRLLGVDFHLVWFLKGSWLSIQMSYCQRDRS